MTVPYDVTFDPCHVALQNLNADGSVSIPDNDVNVIVAVIPLTTGLVPLDAATLVAEIYMSCDFVTNDGTHVGHRRRYPLTGYQGHPTPASMAAINTLTGGGEYYQTGNAGDCFQVSHALNGSGDLQIRIKGLSSGAKPLTFSNLQFSYRILGSK